MNQFVSWVIQNIISIMQLSVNSHKKLSNKEKLEHKAKIKKTTDGLLSKICRYGLRRKVYLVNSNRYFKDYPGNDERLFESYSHIRAELKAVRFDGVEFFESMPAQVYKNSNGELSFKGSKGKEAF